MVVVQNSGCHGCFGAGRIAAVFHDSGSYGDKIATKIDLGLVSYEISVEIADFNIESGLGFSISLKRGRKSDEPERVRKPAVYEIPGIDLYIKR